MPAFAFDGEMCSRLTETLAKAECSQADFPDNWDELCGDDTECSDFISVYGPSICTCQMFGYDFNECDEYIGDSWCVEECSTCNRTEKVVSTTNITGGKRARVQVSLACASGCICGADCSGSSYEYLCTCNSGYSVKNQGASTCSCAAECGNGTYGVSGNCSTCPALQDSNGVLRYGNSASNAKSIDNCYMSPAYKFLDSTGTYEFTNNCYHDAEYGPDSYSCHWFKYMVNECPDFACDGTSCWVDGDGYCTTFDGGVDECIRLHSSDSRWDAIIAQAREFGFIEDGYDPGACSINTPCCVDFEFK